jgi:uncharacterized membrane protein
VVSANRLEVRQCAEHGRRCEHWEAVWARRLMGRPMAEERGE